MLPGFRFLFGAIVLSMSVLVFGFGAAALLRTAHEEFASAPAWRPAPETRFAQSQDNAQATQPVLALLRIDDAPKEAPKEAPNDTLKDADKDAATVEPQALDDVAMKAAAEPATAAPPQPDLDRTAALQPGCTTIGRRRRRRSAPPQAEATASPAAPDQAKLATSAQPSADAPATDQDRGRAGQRTGCPARRGSGARRTRARERRRLLTSFSTKIATLGGPPVTIVRPKRRERRSPTGKTGARSGNDRRTRRAQSPPNRRRRACSDSRPRNNSSVRSANRRSAKTQTR